MLRNIVPLTLLFALFAASNQATAQSAHSEATEATVERLFATPATKLDAALPDASFGAWFEELVPKRSGTIFELTECTARIDGNQSNSCLTIEVDIASRHRTLQLEFARDSLAFRGGVMSAAELEGTFVVTSLADLPKLLKRGMRPFPLTCPADTALNMRESYAGLFEWCENSAGIQHGPARTWFSTGRYLLDRGQYANGNKTGDWTECDRFERCQFNTYVDGVPQ